MTVLFCHDFVDHPACCRGCHLDVEDGYRLHFDSGSWLDTETREVEVCCTVGQWLKTMSDHGATCADIAEAKRRG